jgi:hypothetical protein
VLLVPTVLAGYGITRSGMRRKEAARYRDSLRRDAAGH